MVPFRLIPVFSGCVILFILFAGCVKKEDPAPGTSQVATFGEVPDFRFIERSTRTMGLSDLKGHIWIADFIFTHCAGPCPLMSAEMSRLVREFSDVPRLRFVSFTVDPERDSASVLAAYADRYGAPRDRWFFLTGDRKDLHSLAYNGFHIGDKDDPIFHSQRLILIDSRAQIRGYYDGLDTGQVRRLRTELRLVIGEETARQATAQTNPFTLIPTLNAFLNSTAAILLVAGFVLIRRGRRAAHKRLMLAALMVSLLFLSSYVIYHWQVGSVRFQGVGWVRPLYFTILGTHTLLAVAVVPLVIVTLVRALREKFDRHRVIARWTLPIWIYVSITGVIVYLMLYVIFPAAAGG